MEAALIVSILLYLLSAAGYLAYFVLQKKHLQQTGFIVLVGGFIFHSARGTQWVPVKRKGRSVVIAGNRPSFLIGRSRRITWCQSSERN